MRPRVTVLMPVHNGARFLNDAMRSIFRQSFQEYEFLIVDDCSTDTTVEIIQSFKDPRVRLLRSNTRLRFAGALNLGLDASKGEYVARMDADDISLRRRLEVQVGFLDRHPNVGICGTWVKTFGMKGTTIYKEPVGYENIKATALFDTPFAHPSVMMRRNVMDEHHLRYDGTYYPADDFELWSRAVKCFPCENIDEVLLRYRVHPQSMTVSEWTEMDAKACLVVKRELNELGLSPTEDKIRFHRNIGRGRSYRCCNRAEIERAETWLLKLIRINQSSKKYDRVALRRVIGDVWYRLCFNSAHLGMWVFRKYWHSSVGLPRHRELSKQVFLCLSILRHLRGSSAREK